MPKSYDDSDTESQYSCTRCNCEKCRRRDECRKCKKERTCKKCRSKKEKEKCCTDQISLGQNITITINKCNP